MADMYALYAMVAVLAFLLFRILLVNKELERKEYVARINETIYWALNRFEKHDREIADIQTRLNRLEK